jgi:thiosulfate dehydrogenase
MFTLEDRIVGCFERSLNSAGNSTGPTPQSKEVLALSAYIAWLSEKISPGASPPWRGQNVIPQDKLIPIENLNPAIGKDLFLERCSTCHGENGQGVEIGDKKAGPLWGQRSWNDGAGAARTYTLAGIIRYAMPYLDPGNVTDEEAQQIAAFITSKPRPVFPFKKNDYLKEKIPIDAVYYKQLYMKNPLIEKPTKRPTKNHDASKSR